MTERKAFEAWVIRDGGYLNDADDEAKAARLIASRAWQAATAATQERCAQAVLGLDKEKWFPSQRDFAEASVDAIRKGK